MVDMYVLLSKLIVELYLMVISNEANNWQFLDYLFLSIAARRKIKLRFVD